MLEFCCCYSIGSALLCSRLRILRVPTVGTWLWLHFRLPWWADRSCLWHLFVVRVTLQSACRQHYQLGPLQFLWRSYRARQFHYIYSMFGLCRQSYSESFQFCLLKTVKVLPSFLFSIELSSQSHKIPISQSHNSPIYQGHNSPISQRHSSPVLQIHSSPISQRHSSPIPQRRCSPNIQSHNSPTPRVRVAQTPRATIAQTPRDTIAETPRFRHLFFLISLLSCPPTNRLCPRLSFFSPGSADHM